MATIPALEIPELLGMTLSMGVGFATGHAMGPALSPITQKLANTTWALYPDVPPDVQTLAAGVAQGQVDEKQARIWAKETGFDEPQFSALIDIANVGPGMAQAFNLWRRSIIGEAGFKRALKRLGLEPEWIGDLWDARYELLSPAELAVMVQRGIVNNDGLLPVGPPTGVGKVEPMPMIGIDPVTEAASSGVTKERLAGLARIIGLPASPDLAARMAFRGIIDKVDFDRAISEGNTRNEWRDFLFDGFREIPTAHAGVELRLRGWTDDAGMYKQTARHGMSPADTDILFKITGRPISFHQVFIGERRGGTYDGPTSGIDPAFLKSLRESNIRPEWYNLAWAQRHSYPSAFVLRALTQAGDLTQVESKDILLFIGWPESLADKVSKRWAGTTGAVADPNVKKAEVQLWTTTHRSYIATESGDAEAQARFNLLGISAAAQTRILELWASERGLIRAQLSPADIRKAYQQGDVNAATGTAWTHDDAIAAFLDRGWSMTDAESYLVIPYKG